MLPRFARLLTTTSLVGVLATPAAYAGPHVVVQIGIGAPVVAAPPYLAPYAAPYPGYVWRPGCYVTTVYGPQWVPGAWVPRAYMAGGWGGGYVGAGWIGGGWGHEGWGHEGWGHERWEHERWAHGRGWRGDRGYRGHDRGGRRR